MFFLFTRAYQPQFPGRKHRFTSVHLMRGQFIITLRVRFYFAYYQNQLKRHGCQFQLPSVNYYIYQNLILPSFLSSFAVLLSTRCVTRLRLSNIDTCKAFFLPLRSLENNEEQVYEHIITAQHNQHAMKGRKRWL